MQRRYTMAEAALVVSIEPSRRIDQAEKSNVSEGETAQEVEKIAQIVCE
jgi:hypothetical protein